MRLKLIRFMTYSFLILGGSLQALAQEGSIDTPSSASEDESQSIEDATLDGSGEAAANAANDSGTPKTAPEQPTIESKDPEKLSNNPSNVEQAPAANQASSGAHASPEDEKPSIKSLAEFEENAGSESSAKIADTSVKGRYGGRVFGKYKVQLAANRPIFSDGQKCYEKLYGKPETYFSMSGDWFPVDWWVNPGLMMRMGMYSARGKAALGKLSGGSIDCNALTVDNASRTSFLFVPIQVGPKIQFSPFSQKWLVADVWVAGEYGWWQETRDNDSASFRSSFTLSTDRVYTNTGRKRGVSTGVSAHILLNALDERSVRSMIDSMGLGYVYLTGFMETVKSSSKEGLTFGRNVVGLGFTFESFK
jgi:hypothetical protein